MDEKKRKGYSLEKEEYYGRPGLDIHEIAAEFFGDYYGSDKKHEVSINLNGVTVALKRRKITWQEV